MLIETETAYLSAGCNRVSGCLDWGPEWLAYGSNNGIALCEMSSTVHTHRHTLTGHCGRINALKWVTKNLSKPILLSAASDSKIGIWSPSKSSLLPYTLMIFLYGHTASVTAIDGQPVGSILLVASASADSTIRIWNVDLVEKTSVLAQTIDLQSGICLCLCLSSLPGHDDSQVLHCGFDSNIIGIYTLNNEVKFEMAVSLSGHEDWVHGLACTQNGKELLLASCSQDKLVRVWKFVSFESDIIDDPDDGILKVKQQYLANVNGPRVIVSLDAVLQGHENWVTGVAWSSDGNLLLSASMDKSMVVWHQPCNSSWIEYVRMGDVGGGCLGMIGCSFAPDSNSVLGCSFQGALYMWSQPIQKSDDISDVWHVGVTPGGHFGPVQDLAWEPRSGAYLLSVSDDQTTRLHAPWKRDYKVGEWHELARPQVHGYEMTGLACLDGYNFVSASDEKVVRVFRAPQNFRDNLERLTGCNSCLLGSGEDGAVPQGAMVPALGLSNKAIEGTESQAAQLTAMMDHLAMPCDDVKNQYSQAFFRPKTYTSPPSEDSLMQNTLWPEVKKLYGHGFEVFCVASHPHGKLVATACKASKPEFANILIWETKDWTLLQSLQYHQLTVTQIAFSHNGLSLIGVSRDRTWSLWREVNGVFSLVGYSDKKKNGHTRIIWSVDWTWDDKYFATGSRDKKLIMWSSTSLSQACPPLVCPEPVTAVACSPQLILTDSYLLAVGLETGSIHLLSWSPDDADSSFTCLKILESPVAHHCCVKRLQFRPVLGCVVTEQCDDNRSWVQLASCSADHSVRVTNVRYTDKPCLSNLTAPSIDK